MSRASFKKNELGFLGRLCFNVLRVFCLIDVVELPDGTTEINNLTIINFVLKLVGPTHERTLTTYMLILQIFFSGVAFLIRYQLVKLFYDD